MCRAQSRALWYRTFRNNCHYGSVSISFLSYVATAFTKFPGVIACVAPGALLTRPLLTAKPLDLVYDGL